MSDLHRFTINGEPWVCGVYDHGPFCRLCRPVDETTSLLLELVDEGLVEFVNATTDGELRFRLTPGGVAQTEEMIAADPEMKDFYENALGTLMTRDAERN